MEKLFKIIGGLIKEIYSNREGLYKKLRAMNRRQKIGAAALLLIVLSILLAVLYYFDVFSPEITQVVLSESSL